MKYSFFVFITFVLFENAILAQADFILFKDLQDRFEVRAPGHFDFVEKAIPTQIGEVINENFSLQKTDHPNTLYSINILSYPDQIVDFDSLDLMEELMLNTLNNIAISNNAYIVYKDLGYEDEGTPIMTYRLMDKKKTQSIKGVIKLRPQTIYNAQVYAPIVKSLNEFTDIFLDSFVLKQPITKTSNK